MVDGEKADSFEGEASESRESAFEPTPPANPKFRLPIELMEDWEQQELFLDNLKAYVSIGRTCKITGISVNKVRTWRKEDAKFRELFDEAKNDGNDAIEDEIIRRGMEGIEEPVFYEGIQVATVKKYSDNLLTLLAKSRMPERYREQSSLEVNKQNTILILPTNGRELNLLPDVQRGEVKKEDYITPEESKPESNTLQQESNTQSDSIPQ